MPTTDELQDEITSLKESLNDLSIRAADLKGALDVERDLRERLIDEATPVGTLAGRAGGDNGNVPAGWLPCDGKPVDQNTFPKLFAIIGTSWGLGDGTPGSFNLPDLRGLFLRGVAAGLTTDPEHDARVGALPGMPRSGANGGDRVGSLQGYATGLPVGARFRTGGESNGHTHNASTNAIVQSGPNTFGDGDERGVGGHASVSLGGNNQDHTHEVASGGDAESRPINAAVVWAIKVDPKS